MNCDKGILTHKHHIMPKYMGGSDDPSNLIEVSITRHAMFHFCNYQLWGNDEDRIAYLGLSKQIGSDEIILEKQKLGAKKAIIIQRHRIATDPDYAKKMKDCLSMGHIAALSKEAQEKRKNTFEAISHQQGDKNSQYNTIWIYNVDLKQNKKVPKNSPIPNGWTLGGVIDFDAHIKKLDQQKIKDQKKQDKIKYYENMYDIYINKGFDYIKNTLHYDKTQENLIMLFKKYVKNYVPYDKTRSGVVG